MREVLCKFKDLIFLGSSESISTEGSSESLSSPPIPRELSMVSSQVEQVCWPIFISLDDWLDYFQVVKGRGIIGKILDESSGVIWWILRANHLQSVWFERKHAFLFGVNLMEQDLGEIFGQGSSKYFIIWKCFSQLKILFSAGDAVSFIATRSRTGPTNWVAQQVEVTDDGPGRQHKSLTQSRLLVWPGKLWRVSFIFSSNHNSSTFIFFYIVIQIKISSFYNFTLKLSFFKLLCFIVINIFSTPGTKEKGNLRIWTPASSWTIMRNTNHTIRLIKLLFLTG